MIYAKALRVALAKEGKRHKWLASQLKTNQASISRYCAGDAVPRTDRQEEIAKLFGLSLSEFYALGE